MESAMATSEEYEGDVPMYCDVTQPSGVVCVAHIGPSNDIWFGYGWNCRHTN